MYKLGYRPRSEWEEYSSPPIYAVSELPDGSRRIIAGVPHGDSTIFERMVLSLKPPYYLLYVLHTPRCEERAGRYQSPGLSSKQLCGFIERFKTYLTADSRFDIWGYSPAQKATVVWDRHNMLYAYGPLEKYSKELLSIGFREGEPTIPVPHEHNYRVEMDEYAKNLLEVFEWSYSPLRTEDEQ